MNQSIPKRLYCVHNLEDESVFTRTWINKFDAVYYKEKLNRECTSKKQYVVRSYVLQPAQHIIPS